MSRSANAVPRASGWPLRRCASHAVQSPRIAGPSSRGPFACVVGSAVGGPAGSGAARGTLDTAAAAAMVGAGVVDVAALVGVVATRGGFVVDGSVVDEETADCVDAGTA